jgi:N-acetylneuraminic acid mutarotase
MVSKMGEQRKALLLSLILCFAISNLPLVRAAEDSWATKTPLPIAIAGFKAAAVDEKIYVMKFNLTYEFNLHSWSTKTSMPTPRYDFAATNFQNKIFCIGGKTDSTPLGTNEVYDPITDTWETKTAMPTPRHGLEANLVNGKIYLISGLVPHHLFPDVEGTFELTNITEVYDPVTDTWETRTPIPNPASYYASGVMNNKIYIISETHTDI